MPQEKQAVMAGVAPSSLPPLYYHNDNSFLMYVQPPITLDRFLYEVVGRLSGTQVGGIICHMFSPGDEVPLFHSSLPEAQVVEPGKMASVNAWKLIRNRAALLCMNDDPWTKSIELAHENGQEFWAAMRFNDSHPDSYGLRNRFGVNHGEYYLGHRCGRDDPDHHAADEVCRHLDYTIPEVRDHRLRQAEEVCSLYDVDGLELDFTRDIGHNFPSAMGEEGRHVLSRYLREIRDRLNDVAERRGRPVKLGVRVPGTPEVCWETGHDVARWLNEDLLDVLTPSVYYDTSCELPFDAFVRMAAGSSCRVFASVMEGIGPARFAPPPREVVRGACLNAWRQGVHGINLFNFHHQLMCNCTEDVALLSEIGRPATLEFKDTQYVIAGSWRRYRGQHPSTSRYVPAPDSLGAHPHQLPREIPEQPGGPGISVRVPVGDRLDEARANALLRSLILRLDICNVTGEEEMELTWNGLRIPLAMAKIQPSAQYPWNWNGLHGQLEASFDLTHGDWVKAGDNEFRLILRRRPQDIDLPLMLWALRLEVHYNVLPAYLGKEARD